MWKSALKDRSFRNEALFFFPFFLFIALSYPRFLLWIEARPGIAFTDPLAPWLPERRDMSWLCFAMIYGSLSWGLITLLKRPGRLLISLETYATMILIRMIAMSLLPLDPPLDTIPLSDPLTQLLGGTSGQILKRDLFFSGHTATMTILYLTASSRLQKALFAVGLLLMIGCLFTQRVHYSIDIFAAPFFAYGAFRLVTAGRKRSGTVPW